MNKEVVVFIGARNDGDAWIGRQFGVFGRCDASGAGDQSDLKLWEVLGKQGEENMGAQCPRCADEADFGNVVLWDHIGKRGRNSVEGYV